MRIVFLTNIPSPYRVDFFNELGKQCDLTVIFEKGMSDERDKSWKKYAFKNFKGIILEGKTTATDKAFAPTVRAYLKKDEFDHIVVCNAFTPTGMYAIKYMKAHHISYWIEGDGAFPKKENLIKNLLKRYFILGAQGYFSTSDVHDEYYMSYGVKHELIHRYPFTSVCAENILNEPLSKDEKSSIKHKLGIRENSIVLSVGQFIYRKGFDVLLQAASALDRSIGFYIIGGMPTKEMKDYVLKYDLSNVHYLPFQKTNKLREYYEAADIFVLPTREDIWGLVVNEALAAGLPVITTDKCVSGLELVEDGMNGYIVPSEQPDALRYAISKVLDSDELIMAAEALKTAREYTIQNMSKIHLRVFEKY